MERFRPHAPYLLVGDEKQVLIHPLTGKRTELDSSKMASTFITTAWSHAFKLNNNLGVDVLDTSGSVKTIERSNVGLFVPLSFPYLLMTTKEGLQVWDVKISKLVIGYPYLECTSVCYQDGLVFISVDDRVEVWKEKDLLTYGDYSLTLTGMIKLVPLSGPKSSTERGVGVFLINEGKWWLEFSRFVTEEKGGKLVKKVECKIDLMNEYRKFYAADIKFFPSYLIWASEEEIVLCWLTATDSFLTVWSLSQSKFTRTLNFEDRCVIHSYLPCTRSIIMSTTLATFLYNLDTGERTETILPLPDPEEASTTLCLKETLLSTFSLLLPRDLVLEVWNLF